MKKCRDCGKEKELQDFSVVSNNVDGRHNQCRECMSDARSPNRKNARRRRQYVDEYGETYEDFG